MTRYVVLVERAEDGGFGVWCPDLPGCVAPGDGYGEAISEMKEAIALHLEGLRADGLPNPRPTIVGSATVRTT